MTDETQFTHWSSTIQALNPQKLSHEYGTIIQSIYREEPYALNITVEREYDNRRGGISFFEVDSLGEGIQSVGLPKVIQNIYDAFQVQQASELVGRNVIGVYFENEHLVGIQAI